VEKKATRTIRTPKKKGVAEEIIQYVLPLGGTGWVVKNSSLKKFTVITDSKREAVSIARNLAKAQNVIMEIHGRNGQVEKRESYVA